MPKKYDRERRTLYYPKDSYDPKELLTFIQLAPYTEAFIRFQLTDDEQRLVETLIMVDPTRSAIITETGGIRVRQFSTTENEDRSLNLSAFYAYFPEQTTVVLIGLFQTDVICDMSMPERRELRQLFEEAQQTLPPGGGG